jgi:hypothetical protein
LRRYARDDLVLRLFYAPESAVDAQEMVEQERVCCAFLTFDLDQRRRSIRHDRPSPAPPHAREPAWIDTTAYIAPPSHLRGADQCAPRPCGAGTVSSCTPANVPSFLSARRTGIPQMPLRNSLRPA